MRTQPEPGLPTLCPSAEAEMPHSVVIGLVAGTAAQPRVAYLAKAQPVTPALRALASPASAGEVLRVAAACAEQACQHFDGANCRLVQRVVKGLPAVVQVLPRCAIRAQCRWWLQQGPAACQRCPQLVTRSAHPSASLQAVAAEHAEP